MTDLALALKVPSFSAAYKGVIVCDLESRKDAVEGEKRRVLLNKKGANPVGELAPDIDKHRDLLRFQQNFSEQPFTSEHLSVGFCCLFKGID